jgi:16S rRNA G966 N2-methylase RsmD
MDKQPSNAPPRVYDRALLLYGSKRNEVLTCEEVQQYGLDSFADLDYVSIYGMSPREWYTRGIRVLGRTAVECTRDALADRIGRDIASVTARMPGTHSVVIDPFAGSCNTLFWILRHLPNSEGIAFECDEQVFELTRRNLASLEGRIELVHGDYVKLLKQRRIPANRRIVAFVAPPWGTALDEVQGLDLRRTSPPIMDVIEQIAHTFSQNSIVFGIQVYEKVAVPSLNQLQTLLDWTQLRIYNIYESGRNHGVLLGTRRWIPRR